MVTAEVAPSAVTGGETCTCPPLRSPLSAALPRLMSTATEHRSSLVSACRCTFHGRNLSVKLLVKVTGDSSSRCSSRCETSLAILSPPLIQHFEATFDVIHIFLLTFVRNIRLQNRPLDHNHTCNSVLNSAGYFFSLGARHVYTLLTESTNLCESDYLLQLLFSSKHFIFFKTVIRLCF